MRSHGEALERIESLRRKLHQQVHDRAGGGFASLVPLSEELDHLVVEVTRRQWESAVRKPNKSEQQGV